MQCDLQPGGDRGREGVQVPHRAGIGAVRVRLEHGRRAAIDDPVDDELDPGDPQPVRPVHRGQLGRPTDLRIGVAVAVNEPVPDNPQVWRGALQSGQAPVVQGHVDNAGHAAGQVRRGGSGHGLVPVGVGGGVGQERPGQLLGRGLLQVAGRFAGGRVADDPAARRSGVSLVIPSSASAAVLTHTEW